MATCPKTESAVAAATTECRFRFRCPEGEAVFLIGSFNDWSTCATPMVRTADGVWEAALPLPPGRHTYAYFVIESCPALGRAAWMTSVANERTVLCVPDPYAQVARSN